MKNAITSVSIIGTGNVAFHIARALDYRGIRVTHIASRNKVHALGLASLVHAKDCTIDKLPENQPAIIAVSDDAIAEVLSELNPNIPAAYTSGSVALNQLPPRDRLGVFYPLQTLSKTADVEFREVPMLIESDNENFRDQLLGLALRISDNANVVSSEQRAKLHLAAVWMNNFTNHIVYQSQQITKEQNLDYNLLLPLLKETIRKLEDKTAFEAQTGPARRGDTQTIERHLAAQDGMRKEIYELLTKSIQQTYKND